MADYDLGTARGKIEIDSSGAVRGVAEADAATASLGSKAEASSKGLKNLGVGLAGVGVAAVAGFALAIKTASDFETQLSEFKAVTGATAGEIDTIKEKALQLGADTKFSAGEAAGAMVELGKQGLSVSDILGGAADATTSLAAAGGIELPEAATIAANSLNQFKLQASDLPKVADVLAGAANASATGVKEIGDAMAYVGPVAKTVGLSFEDTAGAIALLSNNGIDASQAGTSLRAILVGLNGVSGPAKDKMKELGLITKDGANQFFDASGKIKPMNEIIGILNRSLGGLSEQQRLQAAETIFGREALAALAAMAGTTQDDFLKLQTTIGNTSAADVAKTKTDNLAGSIDAFKGSIETALIRGGAPFLEGLKGIVDWLTNMVNKFSELSPEVQKWIGYIIAGIGVVGILGGAIALVGSVLGSIGAALSAFGAILGAIFSPIGLIIAAVIALGAGLYYLYQNNETFRNKVNEIWAQFLQGVKVVWAFITDVLIPKIQEIWTNSQPYLQAFAAWFTGSFLPAVQSVWAFLQPILLAIIDFIVTKIIPAWIWWETTIIKVVASIIQWIVNTLVPAIVTAVTWIVQKFQELAAWFNENLLPLFVAIGELFSAMWDRIRGVIEVMVPIWQAIWNVIWTVIQTVWNAIWSVIETVIGWIRSAWDTFGTYIINAFRIAWDTVKGIVEGVIQAIKGIIEVVTGLIRGDWEKVWTGIKDFFGGIWDAIFSAVKGAVDQIVNLLAGAWEGIKSTASTIWNAVKDTVVGLVNSMGSAIGTAVSGIIDFFAGIPGRIGSALSGAKDWLFNTGKDIIQGLWNGIQEIWNNVMSWFSSAMDKIPQFVKDALHISSPSKVMVELGQQTMAGYLLGLQKFVPAIQNELGQVVGPIGATAAYASPGFSSSSLSNATVNINLNFGDGVSAADREAIDKTVNDPGVLAEITKAARAGVGQK